MYFVRSKRTIGCKVKLLESKITVNEGEDQKGGLFLHSETNFFNVQKYG